MIADGNHLLGASTFGGLPSDYKSGAIQTKPAFPSLRDAARTERYANAGFRESAFA
jgi:hypothetical protein